MNRTNCSILILNNNSTFITDRDLIAQITLFTKISHTHDTVNWIHYGNNQNLYFILDKNSLFHRVKFQSLMRRKCWKQIINEKSCRVCLRKLQRTWTGKPIGRDIKNLIEQQDLISGTSGESNIKQSPLRARAGTTPGTNNKQESRFESQ